MDFTAEELWLFLPRGYLLTVAIEIPILLLGLSACHGTRRRLLAGFWLTACTYPIVILVFPLTVSVWFGDLVYLIIAETFAPVVECLLFRVAFPVPTTRLQSFQDLAVITAANVASFLFGLPVDA